MRFDALKEFILIFSIPGCSAIEDLVEHHAEGPDVALGREWLAWKVALRWGRER
jgi:hypothetical protein